MSYTFQDAVAELALNNAESFVSALTAALEYLPDDYAHEAALRSLHASATAHADRLRHEFYAPRVSGQIERLERALARRREGRVE